MTPVSPDAPVLVGDIGGTNARFALVHGDGTPITQEITLPTGQYPDLAAAAQAYLSQAGQAAVREACLHRLQGLPRLWQKLSIEQGWETALSGNTRQQIRRSLRRYGEAGTPAAAPAARCIARAPALPAAGLHPSGRGRPVVIQRVCEQIRIAELSNRTRKKFDAYRFRQLVEACSKMFCEAAIKYAEQKAISRAEMIRRMDEASRFETMQAEFAEMEKEIESSKLISRPGEVCR